MRKKNKKNIIPAEYQKNCIIYVRMSDEYKQNETSIDAQVRECREFAEKQGLRVVNILQDKYSGTVADRAGFEEMKRLARAKPNFAYILVWRYDRFARNQQDTYAAMGYFGSYGISIVSVKEQAGLDQTPQEKLLAGIYIAMAEYFSDELSIKVRRGMYEVSHRFESTGSTPLGYKVENKKYVIDEKTAPIVKEAFELYGNEDKSISEIVAIFKKKGYKTAAGKDFSISSFESIFSNRKYIGVYSYSSTNSNDEIEVVEQKDAIPPIISESLFNLVQDRKARNKRTKTTAAEKAAYQLTGRVRCGYCNGPISGESAKSHGITHYYYSCYNYRKKKCSRRIRIDRDYLEQLVARLVVKFLSNEKYLDEMIRLICLDPERDALVLKLNMYEDQKKQKEKLGDDFYKRYLESTGMMQKKLMEDYNNCMTQAASLDEEIIKIKEQLAKPRLAEEQVRKHIKKVLECNVSDSASRKIMIDTFVHQVDVFDDKLDVIIETPDLLPVNNNKSEAVKKSYYRIGESVPIAEIEKVPLEEIEDGTPNYDALLHDSTLNELVSNFNDTAAYYDEPSKLSDFDVHKSSNDDDPDPDPNGPKPKGRGGKGGNPSTNKKSSSIQSAIKGDKSGNNYSRSSLNGTGEPSNFKLEPLLVAYSNGNVGFVVRIDREC